MDYASAWGPVSSEALAEEHNCSNYRNTGGYQRRPLLEVVCEMDMTDDSVLAELIGTAQVPKR